MEFLSNNGFRNFVYGLIGAFLAAGICFIASIIYPATPVFVTYIGVAIGFFVGLFFGAAAIMALLDTFGAV